jgi:CheY-like chemotaxis protein
LQLFRRESTETPEPMTPTHTLAIADDDPEHCELVSRWLERHGYAVRCFHSGDELIAWAQQASEPVAAFLLDVDMPGRDGFESCRGLRALDRHAGIPAVFVTSTAVEFVEKEVFSAGGDYLVRKDENMLGKLGAILATLSAGRSTQ